MRRTEYIITELRNSTDVQNANGVLDAELIGYLNDGQKAIQGIIFDKNIKADLFKEVVEYEATADGTYTLPDDIYAVNSLSLVEGQFGYNTVNDGYRKIDRVDEDDRANLFGYFTRNNQLILTGLDQNLQILSLRVTYFRKLPKMDKRWGTIQSFTPNTSIVVASGYDSNANTVDDYVSVVDKFGAQIRGGIFIDTFTGATWSTSDALTGISTGQYVCMGKDSVNASELPDECETYLKDYVRQRVINRGNYNDANKQVYFTESQKDEIARLFANNQKDSLIPPISDTTFLEF